MRTSLCVAAALLACQLPSDDKILFQVDFSNRRPVALDPLSHPRWPPETKAKAASFSKVDVQREKEDRPAALHVRVAPEFPWQDDHFVIFKTSYDYLPPECDAIRLRAKVLNGKFEVCFGSPTVYFGCSDVKTAALKIEAAEEAGGDYKSYEFSLNKGLSRDFMRAGLTIDQPFIQYVRWVQGPVFMYAAKGSVGEIAISSIEFISKGEGKPYASGGGARDSGKTMTLVDFLDKSAADKIFTCSLQNMLPVDGPPPKVSERRMDGRIIVEYGAGRTQFMQPPPEISLKDKGAGGRLSVKKKFCEEIVFGGVRIDGASEVNAIEFSLIANQEIIKKPDVVVDVLLLTSPGGSGKFKWSAFAPPPEWRGVPDLNFSYYMGGMPAVKEDYAIFHCRRVVEPEKLTRLLIPLSDFLCCYGQGEISEKKFKKQLTPVPEDMIAIGFLVPLRHSYTTTELLVGDLKARCVEKALDRPSFFQNKE